jgi:hypothetical protein
MQTFKKSGRLKKQVVIPAQAGIHLDLDSLDRRAKRDSSFLRE